MEKEKLTKQKANEFMTLPGEALKVDWEPENKMAELGYPLQFNEINPMGFYPLGLDALSMAAAPEIFDYDKQKFIEIGPTAPKLSIFLKIFLSYFVLPKQAVAEAPKMRRRHSQGDLEIVEFNQDQGAVITCSAIFQK